MLETVNLHTPRANAMMLAAMLCSNALIESAIQNILVTARASAVFLAVAQCSNRGATPSISFTRWPPGDCVCQTDLKPVRNTRTWLCGSRKSHFAFSMCAQVFKVLAPPQPQQAAAGVSGIHAMGGFSDHCQVRVVRSVISALHQIGVKHGSMGCG